MSGSEILAGRNGSTLERLVAPLPRRAFLRDYWPGKWFVSHGPVERFPSLFLAPELQSLEALIAAGGSRTEVWSGRDRVRSAPIDPRSARNRYDRGGRTIRLGGIETVVPIVNAILREVGRELETPLNESYCNAYASPAGARTAMHFDEQDVFIVQISGRKLWRIAPNRSVRAPAFGYSGGPLGPLERAQLSRPLPRRMPRTATAVETSPGTVMFLPRGTWHQTRALEDSLALTMSYACSSWKDVLLALLDRSLVLREEWRTVAVGLSAEASGPEALDHFDGLIAKLGRDLAARRARAMVPRLSRR